MNADPTPTAVPLAHPPTEDTPHASADAATPHTTSRSRMRAEVLIVLGLSLGQSAVYAIVTLIARYMAAPPIGKQTTTLNPSRSSINYLDLTYQILNIAFALVPVALALFLLSSHGGSWKAKLGFTRNGRSPWRDVALGAGLAAAIGLPGLGLYAVGRAIGQTVRIDTSGLPNQWWSAMILLASAGVAGLLEEIIVVGYLITRLRQMRWSVPTAILVSALLRGTYHLYQGWPMALGNAVMGAAFAWVFVRTGRVGPLVLAHWTLDTISFVGPELVPASWIDAINGG